MDIETITITLAGLAAVSAAIVAISAVYIGGGTKDEEDDRRDYEDTKMATLRAGKGEHETFISPERLRTFTDIGRELGFDITLFDMTLF